MRVKRVSEGRAKNSYEEGDVIKVGELRYQLDGLGRFIHLGSQDTVARRWAPWSITKRPNGRWDAVGFVASTPRAALLLAMKQAQNAVLNHYNGYALAAKNTKKELVGIREFLSSVKSKSKQVSK